MLFNTAFGKRSENYQLKHFQEMWSMWKTLYNDNLAQKLTMSLVSMFEMTSAQPITSLYWSSDIRDTFYMVPHQLYNQSQMTVRCKSLTDWHWGLLKARYLYYINTIALKVCIGSHYTVYHLTSIYVNVNPWSFSHIKVLYHIQVKLFVKQRAC